MPEFDHWLVTRFNVPFNSYPGRSTNSVWLEHRLSLFEKYCLPSVSCQSCQEFRWLVLFDYQTPLGIMSKILTQQRDFPFYPLLVGTDWIRESASYLARISRSGYLLTTRLDNDDAIHQDYMKVMQAGFRERPFEFLEFPWGLKLEESRRKLYKLKYKSNPFLTLVERVTDNVKTVYCCNHRQAAKFGPIRQLKLKNAWLQIVHLQNLMNRIQEGLTPVPLSRLVGNFPGLRVPEQMGSFAEGCDPVPDHP